MDTIHVRGEGGVVWEMDLPLSKDHTLKLADGRLTRVHADGTPHEAAPADAEVPEAVEDEDDSGTLDPVAGELRVPGKAAPKSEWVAYGVSRGMDLSEADGMTKQDLVERFGEK